MARSSRSRSALALAAALVLAGVTACGGGGGGGWTAPHKGQAAVLLQAGDPGTAKDGDAASLGFNGTVQGLTVGTDGNLYSLGAGLVRVGEDRKAQVVLRNEVSGAKGLVPLPHGAFAVGNPTTVDLLAVGGKTTVMAGSSGAPRAAGAAVPASVDARTFHFAAGGPVPFGVRPDGSVLIADTDVVWALKDGRLDRLYQVPSKDAKRGMAVLPPSAVDHAGTVYVAVGGTYLAPVSDITTIRTDGTVGTLALPAMAAGVAQSLLALNLLWLTGDGADGVYARAQGGTGDYVLHLRSGHAELVARYPSTKPTATCDLSHPVDAKKLTCALPHAMTYDAGSLVLGGEAGYVLKIAVA
jgi:hypothetical protein